MFTGNRHKKLKIFLAYNGTDAMHLSKVLENVLLRAGMEILKSTFSDELNMKDRKTQTEKLISQADCSVHIIGNEMNTSIESRNEKTITQCQFDVARKLTSESTTNFKLFVWHPFELLKKNSDEENFVNTIRNNIMRNMIFSTQNSPVMFVEDIRSVMQVSREDTIETSETEVFFIYNELDVESADNIANLLKDVVQISQLSIVQDTQKNYSDIVVQQIRKSKLAVVYFKLTAEWALPFVQQVWKKTGGASSNTDIMLIGDANLIVNDSKIFEAPKVISKIVAEELIPLEIKVHYDKTMQN